MTTKNDQVIRETEYNLHGPGVYGKRDAVSLEPPSRLINQELQDEGTNKSAGYLPRLAIGKVLFVTGK